MAEAATQQRLARDGAGHIIHTPVMAGRIVELLAPALDHPGAVLVDGTLGMAGHAAALLEACPQARLVGIDRDGAALQVATTRLADEAGRAELVRARFDELDDVLDALGLRFVDAVLFDLGLSSLQIDTVDRGFAYATDAPLDMRMDDRQAISAAQVVNTDDAGQLTRIFRDLGEEPHAARIAAAIVAARETQPIETSGQLVAIVREALPASVRYASGRGHPAKRVFQALRIEVNGELDALRAVLPQALARLAPGGRMAVLSYHSLEDRLVKQAFARATRDEAPRGLPVVPVELQAKFTPLTRGAQRPDPAEAAANPRAASAKLRAVARKPAADAAPAPTSEEHR
ncbi:MAG: 16S rRNA (cytosine(1402)-N(4))-methyltransferase RsmH [Propionibacteriaceae bacterium]|nr:16S rRNA (cytosine(1402)-N(4))-methyltransferase RsmH [Propionibacteriaceae bacterium]